MTSLDPSHKMNDHRPALKEMINSKFNSPDAFEDISSLLRWTGAVLAGGSILQVIAEYKTPTRLDLDFYCPTKFIPAFISKLTKSRNHAKNAIFDKKLKTMEFCLGIQNNFFGNLYLSTSDNINSIKCICDYSKEKQL